MSNNRGGPPRPPVGGAATRANHFQPPGAGGPIRAPRPEAPRAPAGGGLLEMVPLNHDDDEVEAKGDGSATQFFAIPAPKAERNNAGPSGPQGFTPPPVGGFAPPPMPGGPPPAMPGMPPPPPAMGPMGGPPMPPPGMRAPGQPPPAAAQGGFGPGMIQGPVVGYGGAAGGAGGPMSPFQVGGGAQPPPAADDTGRTESQRVYAILTAVMLLVCVAAVGALFLKDVIKPDPKPIAAANPSPAPAPSRAEPEPEPEPDPEPAPRPRPSGGSAARPKPSGGGGGGGAAAPAPAPKANGGALTVRINPPDANSSVELVCSGKRDRAPFRGGTASFSGVPNEDCQLFFKGGVPGKYSPVRGGQTINCEMIGSTANCR